MKTVETFITLQRIGYGVNVTVVLCTWSGAQFLALHDVILFETETEV